MQKSLLIYTQQLQRKEALLIRVAAAALANFTCHGNMGVKIVSQKLVRAARQNGKAERMELTCWLQTLPEQDRPLFLTGNPVLYIMMSIV